METIRVGDIVRVVEEGQSYTTYLGFFARHEINADGYNNKNGSVFENNSVGKVEFIGMHEHENSVLAVVTSNNKRYLIRMSGIEFVSRDGNYEIEE